MQTNNIILSEYLPILIFIGVATFLAVICLVIPKILGNNISQRDKLSQYECGFDAFENSRTKLDIRFYLVAILFIIFDLEIAFLIPWALNLKSIGLFGFWSMMIFLVILTIGFVYEWRKGALEWE
ncbi:MAG: NADH-quinone oxidoreductase subunit A [Rickettsiaceae bacterium]|nr:NADH-quinone oxidoreductase subunit A [Rickettsiaceae bacterium]